MKGMLWFRRLELGLVFLLWGIYILIHGLWITGSWNLWHSYLIIGCLLTAALDSCARDMLMRARALAPFR